MAKGKKKEKTKKTKKVKPVVMTWREQLSSMNPNAVRKGCSVEVSMLVEGFPKYLDSTQKLQFYTYPRATLKLQCVIYEEILYIIKHYPAWKRSYLDANVETILQQAVEEAKPFLKSRNPIPPELMAQLIKLRVIMSVQEHVCAASGQTPVASSAGSSESSSSTTFTKEDAISLEERSLMIEHIYEEEATTMSDVSEYNDEDVFGNIPEIDEVLFSDSSTELRGYIRALKSKREEFLRRTGERKPEKSPEEASSIYDRVSKPPWSIKHRKWKKQGTSASKSVVFDEEERSLHLILTGFYDVALIAELRKIGLPIVCLIGVAKDREAPAEPVFSQKIWKPLESIDDIQTRHVPIYNYTLHSANEQLKNYSFTAYYKKLILYHCYETLEELLDSDPTLQDIIYFRCEPTLEQGEDIYERVCELVEEIPRLRTVHSEYLRKIELCHLGKTPKAIPVAQMIYYNASLDRVPSDCFSISVLLDSLVEEVCQSTSPNSDKAQEERECAKSFKFKRVPKDPLQFMRRRNTMKRSSSLDLKVDLSMFMVHEKNVLETSLRYYPQVKERLLAVNLAYLGLSSPALLWRRYPKSENNSHLDENQYFHWASSLQLSREELDTCLQVYMCKFLTCSKSSRAEVTCDLQKYFRKPFEVAPDTKGNEEKTPDLRWQEDCSRKTMLQEVREASVEFGCMDHVHVPFMDVIFLRFHDDSDDFGISTRTWSEMIRAPVGPLDFFKWVLHQDKDWIAANLDGPNAKTLFGYDFGRWLGIQGVSTTFRSSEGFSIRVDKERCFKRVPHLSIHYEASGHSLHLNTPTQNDGFMFHFLLANGCRVLFAKPFARVAEGKNCEGYRKSTCKIERPKPICYYLVEKTSYAFFEDRKRFCKPQLMTGASLKDVLRRSSTISELDSLGSVELKPKRSSVALSKSLSKSRNRNGRLKRVFKRIKTFKKSVVPRFKICSSILHRYRYVKVDRERLTINFANFTTTIKFIPSAKLKYQVEISPCFYLPALNEEGRALDAVYDVRVSLPSGLQVQTRKGLRGSYHVVQYYATEKGPTCKNIEDEVSRTYLRSGFVCVKYADGSLKLLGVNGVGAKCEAPFVAGLRQKTRRRKPRGLIQRYQGKFVGGHLKHYRRRLKGGWKGQRDPDLMELRAKIGSAEFVTGDGRKFSANRGGRVDVRVDFEVYGREVGAHSSINQNGELTTVYPDGTRITSWYRVEQDMVVVSGDSLSGQLELDEDDYLCNFLIPRRGGWISVRLNYQFEHPNYATVVYGEGNSMQLRLPGGAELRTQTKGYSLNVKEQIFADVSATKIVLHGNFCRKCYDSCVTKFNVKHLYENSKSPSANACLLVTNDNFGKVFRVTYDGRWHRNEDYKTGKVKRDCLTHRKAVSEKYYAWNRDLSGRAFWNQDMYLNRMMAAQYGKTQRVKYYLDDEGRLMAYEFLKYVRRHYCQRFLMEYVPPDPPVLKLSKPPHSDNPFETIAFTKRSFLKVIPDCEREPPSRDDADDIRVSFDFGDFSEWVKKIQERVDENKEKCQFPKSDSFVPIAPKNSPLSLPETGPKITRRSSETDQINLLASTLPTALLVQDDFLREAPALSNLSSGIEVSRSEPKFKDKSTCTTIRFDLFRDDHWRVAPGETSPTPPPVSVDAKPKSVPKRKEFVCERPTRIEPPMEKPKAKATSTVTLEASCRCDRSLRDLIRENPQITSEFVGKKPRPDPAALQKHSLYAKNIIKRNQKLYKQLECKLLGKRCRPKAQVRTSIQHLRRDSCESVISQELQSTLPVVLPASTSEDSCKILLAPKSAIVTRSEKKFARPFLTAQELTVEALPKEEEDSVGEDKSLRESYQQVDNLTPQAFDVFLKMLRKRLGKIEEVDDSETVRKVGECFDLLIEEEEMPFPKKIAMFRDSLKLLRTQHEDADCPKSGVANVII